MEPKFSSDITLFVVALVIDRDLQDSLDLDPFSVPRALQHAAYADKCYKYALMRSQISNYQVETMKFSLCIHSLQLHALPWNPKPLPPTQQLLMPSLIIHPPPLSLSSSNFSGSLGDPHPI